MRKVKANIWDSGSKSRIEIEGIFHTWGGEGVEDQKGNYGFTIAIIELADGRIVTAAPENVQFLVPSGGLEK